MMYYLFAIGSALLITGDVCSQKFFEKKAGSSIDAGLIFNAVNGLTTALVFWAVSGFSIHFTLYSCVFAAAAASMGMAYCLMGFKMMKLGPVAAYSISIMSGGMIVPYVWGVVFLNEKLMPLRTVGVAVILVAVVLTVCAGNKNDSGKILSAKFVVMCVFTFLANGAVSTLTKVHQVSAGQELMKDSEFIVITGITKLVIGLAVYLLRRAGGSGQRLKSLFPKPVVLSMGIASATIGGGSYMLQLVCASNLPATVLYPFLTGGSVIFSAVAGWVVFREKPPATTLVGVALCLAGTCLFL